MKNSIFKIVLLQALLSGLFFAIPVAAQEQEKPTFKTKVRLVEISVQAKDKEGHHVTDLTQNEIKITAGGKQREVRLFKPVTVGLDRFSSVKALGVEYGEPTKEEIKQYPPRHYLLLFHQVQFRFGSFQRAKQAAIDFVQQRMLPNDFVSVVGFDKIIDFQLDFTNDKGKVLEALENMHLKHRNIRMRDEFYVYLQELARRLAREPYKVTIILIAEGMQGIREPSGYRVYENTMQLLQAADIRIFGVDAGGLNLKDPGATIARFSSGVAALIYQSFNLGLFTEPTGGRYYRYHNNIKALFEQVDYEMSAYYIVGFYLDEGEDLDSPMKLSISTTRQGVDLLYKKGFKRIRSFEELEEEMKESEKGKKQ